MSDLSTLSDLLKVVAIMVGVGLVPAIAYVLAVHRSIARQRRRR